MHAYATLLCLENKVWFENISWMCGEIMASLSWNKYRNFECALFCCKARKKRYSTQEVERNTGLRFMFPLTLLSCCTASCAQQNRAQLRFLYLLCSGAPAAQRAAKRSNLTIGTEPHAYIEIGNHATFFSYEDEDDKAREGGHIPTCSLGLQPTSWILENHVIVNWHLSKQGICWPVSRTRV